MTRSFVAITLVVLALAHLSSAAERYVATGMVLDVDRAHGSFVASIERIPGFMAAMTMTFTVADARELEHLVPGAMVEFTLVVDRGASHAEGIRVRRYQNLEQDPMAAHRLALLKDIARGRSGSALSVGDHVPDFTLTDQKSRSFSLSELRGKVVAINFMYTACQLPDFCLRMVNHFAALRSRFTAELGGDLVFLTITFDPMRDQPDVLDRYASRWKPDPNSWRFLTGPAPEVRQVLDRFGVSAFPNEGLMDHSLHTVLIDRHGNLAANIEGNRYSSDQLAELTRVVLNRPPTGTTRR
jgi:protein SCO1/2